MDLGIQVAQNAVQLGKTQKEEHLAEVIDAQIDELTEACHLLVLEGRRGVQRTAVEAVAAAMVGAADSCVIDIAQFARIDQFLCNVGLAGIQGADLDGQLLTGCDGAVAQQLGVKIGRAHGLFGIAGIAGLHNGHGNGGVQVVVDTDVYGVNVVPLEHFAEISVQILLVEVILFAPLLQLGLIDLSCGDHFDLGNVAPYGHVAVGNGAGTDNRDADFFL